MLNPPPPDPFLIGVHGFAPEFDPVHHVCHYVRGVIANPATLDERQLFLSATHYQLARDLGANLISTTIHPDFLFTPTADNVVHQICDAASPTTGDTLRVGLLDFGISNLLAGERIMLHPESDLDFGHRGDFDLVPAEDFNDLPVDSAKLASPLDLPYASVHAIKMEAGKGVVSGVVSSRKEDLSLFRAWWDSTTRKDNSASGLYIVSVTVQLLAPLGDSDSDLPLMHLDISTVDSANPMFDRNLRFTLRERHFFDSLDQLITTPIEVVLGMIELREWVNAPNAPPIPFVDYRRSDNSAWADTTLLSYAKILGRFDRDSTARVTAKWEAFDITLSYDDNSSATFLLDAVCLSSPRTFAMFHPGHRIFYPSTDPNPPAELEPRLTAWQHTRAGFTSRIDAILTDNGRVATPFPALRFLYGPEQGLHSAQWALGSVANLLLRERPGNHARLFCATGYSESPEVSAAFSRRFASGYYCYPVPGDHLSPVYPDSTPGGYHHHLNRADFRGFVETSRRYRNHAETRKQLGTVHPWLPFVQNHTNLYADSLGKWATWDFDPLREPTAAELRHQCNIALAHAADGLLFYQFSSAPWITSNPFWPRDTATWKADFAAGHPFSDPNAGSIGFVDPDPTTGFPIPRRADWNGESKWDSAATYINEFLRPVSELVRNSLEWRGAKIWSIRNHQDAGVNTSVNQVVSMRQDAASPIDEEDSTFVIVSEFVHKENKQNYLFVLNGRTHPIEGHRHVSVKLNPGRDPDDQWLVENVMSGDLWVVRPTAVHGGEPTSNAFTDYFPPGSAALYRLTPMEIPRVDLRDTCFAHTLTVTPSAVLSMDAAAIRLTTTGTLIIEDSTTFSNCAIECCDLESHANIYVRNGGALHLVGTTLSPSMSTVSRVPISIGPLSRFTSERTIYSGIPGNDAALSVVDGHASTLENAIDLSGGGTFVNMLGGGELLSRQDSVQGNTAFFSFGINALGGRSFIEGTRLLNLGIPLMAQSGSLIQGCDTSSPVIGRNKIRANTMAMYCQNSEIFFGERPWGTPGNWYASQNSIGVLDPTNWYHASAPSGYIYAQANYWGYGAGTPLQACAPHVSSNVSTNYALTSDPVPFTGGTGGDLSKSTFSAAAPPSGIRAVVHGYLAGNARADARNAMASFLQNGGGATARIHDLAFLYRTAKQVDGQALVAGILAALDNRQDLRSKLLAADILEEEDDIPGALSVLNSYSFAGSDTLLRDALLRKAILHPQAGAGGYAHGVAVLDTLATLVAFDSTLAGFIERYPRLMSNLSRRGRSATPKSAEARRFQQALPDGIDVWPNYPNPFSDVTSFTFKLGEDGHVRLAVYDAIGREVAVVTDADYPRGVHSTVLRSLGLPSGLYFYRLTTDAGVIQRKMLLMR